MHCLGNLNTSRGFAILFSVRCASALRRYCWVPVIVPHFVEVDLLFIIRGVRKLQNSLELLMERIISFGGARLLRMYIVVYIRNSILSLRDP